MADRKTTNTDVIWTCLLMLGLGSLGTWHYSQKLVKAMGTERWQPVAGEIVKSEMVRTTLTTPSKFSAEFLYQYSVNEKVLTSNRVSWANTGRSGVGLYHIGEAVTVYVNPLAPHEAVLIQGTNAWTYVQISLCVAFSAFSVWLWFTIKPFTTSP